MNETLTIRLPATTRSELNAIARQEGVPVAAIVRASLERYLSVRRFRALRKKILPFAEAQGLLTDEEVFKALER